MNGCFFTRISIVACVSFELCPVDGVVFTPEYSCLFRWASFTAQFGTYEFGTFISSGCRVGFTFGDKWRLSG